MTTRTHANNLKIRHFLQSESEFRIAGTITHAILIPTLPTDQKFSDLLKSVRLQLSLSQEDIARELGVSFATVNRWENEKAAPSRLARAQFERFCKQMISEGKLSVSRLERGGNSG